MIARQGSLIRNDCILHIAAHGIARGVQNAISGQHHVRGPRLEGRVRTQLNRRTAGIASRESDIKSHHFAHNAGHRTTNGNHTGISSHLKHAQGTPKHHRTKVNRPTERQGKRRHSGPAIKCIERLDRIAKINSTFGGGDVQGPVKGPREQDVVGNGEIASRPTVDHNRGLHRGHTIGTTREQAEGTCQGKEMIHKYSKNTTLVGVDRRRATGRIVRTGDKLRKLTPRVGL